MATTTTRHPWWVPPTTDEMIADLEREGDLIAAEALELADAGDLDQAQRRAQSASDTYAMAAMLRGGRGL